MDCSPFANAIGCNLSLNRSRRMNKSLRERGTMKALSIGLLAITIFIVGVGFFRLWFVLSSPGLRADER